MVVSHLVDDVYTKCVVSHLMDVGTKCLFPILWMGCGTKCVVSSCGWSVGTMCLFLILWMVCSTKCVFPILWMGCGNKVFHQLDGVWYQGVLSGRWSVVPRCSFR